LVHLSNTWDKERLYFDLLTIDFGSGADLVLELFTVPGQNFYVAARRRILREADGIVFVADSRRERLGANVEALHDVVAAIEAAGRDVDSVPAVLQLNKCDEPTALASAELLDALGCSGEPFVEAVAHEGRGVVETLRLIARVSLAGRRVPEPAL
jgi:signal recognition particle receptor subunit beta